MRSAEIQKLIDAVEATYGRVTLYGSDPSEEHGTCFRVPGAAATLSVETHEGELPPGRYDIQIEGQPPGDYIYTDIVSLDRILKLIARVRGPEDQWPGMDLKALADLTSLDFERHPVWKCHDGPSRDDATARVEPADRTSLSDDDDEVFVAATRFTLADGSQWSGFCSPQDSSGLDYVQPVILTESGPNPLWFEQTTSAEVEADWWRRLGRSRDAVFPIAWECLVPVDGVIVRGVVDRVAGFGRA